MLLWVIQITVLSILLIALIHHLIQFFTNMLTVQKVREYKQVLKEQTQIPLPLPLPLCDEPVDDIDSMKNELKQFLQSQLHR